MNQQVTLAPPANARMEAMMRFRGGEGLESNPFPKGSADYDAFQWEMHKLQYNEFMAEIHEDNLGV